MDYTVGSLAALISGKGSSTIKSKVIFKPVERSKRGLIQCIKTDIYNCNKQILAEPAINKQVHNSRKRKIPERDLRKDKDVSAQRKIAHLSVSYKEEYYDTRFHNIPSLSNLVPSTQSTVNILKQLQKRNEQKPQAKLDLIKESRTVCVKNVPYNLSSQKIKKFFEKYGVVESIRFRCAPLPDVRIPKKVAIIKKNFHPQRNTIYVFVCFKSKKSAEEALGENGKLIQGHHIFVDKAVMEKDHNKKKAVFLGNVPFDAEEEDLWKMFEKCGKIVDIRIVRDIKTGIGKGFAYINFESSDCVELALALNGEELNGRELRVSRITVKSKKKSWNASQRTTKDTSRKQDVNVDKQRNGKHKLEFQGQAVTDNKRKKKKKVSKVELKRRKILKVLNMEGGGNKK